MTGQAQAAALPPGPFQSPAAPPAPSVRYGLTLAAVAAATLVAFVVDHLIQTPNLSLIFVLPVVFAAAGFGWGPALAAAVAGVAAYEEDRKSVV